ncbi:hypothetical protein C8Q74DRAFT_1447637 [Fomes fomentarius]|nr:hypothetical protein C8Q74DRAFT_1447637 [Fomes fomentarius]
MQGTYTLGHGAAKTNVSRDSAESESASLHHVPRQLSRKKACENCHAVHKRCVGPLPCKRCKEDGYADRCIPHERRRHIRPSRSGNTGAPPPAPPHAIPSNGAQPRLPLFCNDHVNPDGPTGPQHISSDGGPIPVSCQLVSSLQATVD